VVGSLSAWATGGALAGTFGTGFVLVPLLPGQRGGPRGRVVLIGAGLLLGLRARTTTPRSAGGLLAGAVLVGLVPVATGSPCLRETTYHCADIVEDRGARVLILDDLRHSVVDLDDPRRLDFAYVRWIGDAIDAIPPRPAPLDGIYVGGGGLHAPAVRGGHAAGIAGAGPRGRRRARRPRARRARAAHRAGPAGDRRRRPRDAPRAAHRLGRPRRRRRLRLARRPVAPGDGGVGGGGPAGCCGPGGCSRRTSSTSRRSASCAQRRRRSWTPSPTSASSRCPGPPAATRSCSRPTARCPPARGSSARGAETLDRAAVARFAAGADVLRDDDAPADQLLSPR
jgi:hypothetical protein